MRSRFGKNLVMVGLWAGIGIWIGMHLGTYGGTATSQVPAWNTISATPQIDTRINTQKSSEPAYVYIPVMIDSATGAYTTVPAQIQKDGSAVPVDNLPQQTKPDYSTLSPGQILVPEGQSRTVDVLADKTAGLLQKASQKGIRWVVSLFDSTENGVLAE